MEEICLQCQKGLIIFLISTALFGLEGVGEWKFEGVGEWKCEDL